MSDGWGHDTFDDFADGFDEGFGRGPEGFSDFQEDWGTVDAFWESDGDAAGPPERSDDFADEPVVEQTAEAGDDDPWGIAEMTLEQQEEYAEAIVGAVDAEFSSAEGNWELDEAALDAEWSAANPDTFASEALPGDGDDRRADDDDEQDEYRDKRV